MVFDSMIPDMLSNKETHSNSNSIIWGRKLNISLVFIHNLIFQCQKVLD